MPRSSFGLASLSASLTVLSFCGTASAQWFSGSGAGCGCSAPSYLGAPPIMQQSAVYSAASMSTASYAYGDGIQSGPAICHIEQPVAVMQVQVAQPVVQTVSVQQLQPVVHPVIQNVQVTEYQPEKQTISKPVVRTEWVDQVVTEMRPVTEQKTVNVSTVDYQNVTEYKTERKQVGYWVTKNTPTGKVPSWQYDNRPNIAGFINRTGYDMRNAFTPQYRQERQFVPQTMTCTVPYTKKVAVPGMKQVTYNVTRMEPTQTTRKVAVNKVDYVPTEITVMKPVQVVRQMQTGTRISYAPIGSPALGAAPGANGAPATSLKPTPDANSSQQRAPRSADKSGDNNPYDKNDTSMRDEDSSAVRMTESVVPAKKFTAPSVVRVNQWVARTPSKSAPQPGGKSAAISIADSSR
ncbi:hypothetical protein [Schlesneria sp. DSM 10557]|uniref:hypothetical protein n=1 Tax=Schlesneria sp. DSM 10557 TaxID=3044399 RepID=UPI00359F70F2